MSDQISLVAQLRDIKGKTVKNLRKDGLVPAVVHNHGKESTHVQVDYQELVKVLRSAGRHAPVALTVGDKKLTVLVRSTTRDPKLHTFTHVVFNSVRANQKVEAEIPVVARYDEGNETSPAERIGLIVLSQLDEVEVKAFPKDLPNEIFFDAEKLVAVGDQITVADLDVPAGVEIVTDGEHVVATVFEPSALAAANDEAGGDAEAVAPATELTSEETDTTTKE